MKNLTKRQIVWIVVIALILLIPLTMQFEPFSGEVQWNEALAYSIMLLALGGVYELWQWLKKQTKKYRIAFAFGFIGMFLLGWVSGAVGIIGSENNPSNLLYWGVPAVIVIGSLISRFKSRGMAYTMFASAFVQFLIPIVALIISKEVSWGNAGVVGVFLINIFFVLLFLISAINFINCKKTE